MPEGETDRRTPPWEGESARDRAPLPPQQVWWALALGLCAGTVGGWFVDTFPALLWPVVAITIAFAAIEYGSLPRLHRCALCGERAEEMYRHPQAQQRPWWMPIRSRDHVYLCRRDESTYLNLEAAFDDL